MAWTRASQLDRTIQCPGHLTLPHSTEKSDRAIESAAYGTMVHRWKETGEVTAHYDYPGHAKTFEKKLAVLSAAGITRQDIWPVSGYHEVSFAYNCIDSRLGVSWLPSNKWKARYPSEWITGTADFVSWDGDLWVDDLKTGMLFESQPDELSQLFFYAMCLHKYRNGPNGVKVSVTHWPKYPIDALPSRVEAVIPHDQLLKCERYLKKMYADFAAGKAPFNMGDECTYCPAIANCPLQKKIVDKENI